MTTSENDFIRTIEKCWSRETAMDPKNRSEQNPSYSQCLATALLARDELWLSVYVEKLIDPTTTTSRYHFFNKDIHNNDIRFCEEQFTHMPDIQIHKQRERIIDEEHLSIIIERNPEVQKKYDILKEKFQSELEKTIR